MKFNFLYQKNIYVCVIDYTMLHFPKIVPICIIIIAKNPSNYKGIKNKIMYKKGIYINTKTTQNKNQLINLNTKP